MNNKCIIEELMLGIILVVSGATESLLIYREQLANTDTYRTMRMRREYEYS